MPSKNINNQPRLRLSTPKKIFITCAIILVLIGLFVAYTLTGFTYTVARIRCGHQPIVHVVSFEDTRQYLTPSNPMYKYYAHDVLNEYYCSEADAKEAGLSKDLSPSEYQSVTQEAETKSLLKNSPVNFPVYSPSTLPEGVSRDNVKTENPNITLQDLKRNNAGYGYIRQGKIGGTSDKQYWLCNDSRYPCNELGKTSNGLIVYKTYYPGGNSTVWGIRTETTYIVILIFGQQQSTGLNDQTVLSAFNTLQRVN